MLAFLLENAPEFPRLNGVIHRSRSGSWRIRGVAPFRAGTTRPREGRSPERPARGYINCGMDWTVHWLNMEGLACPGHLRF